MEFDRRQFATLVLGSAASATLVSPSNAQSDPLPSWNDGPTTDAIVKFVHATTDFASPNFVPRRGAHRDLRSGRHAVGRASDL